MPSSQRTLVHCFNPSKEITAVLTRWRTSQEEDTNGFNPSKEITAVLTHTSPRTAVVDAYRFQPLKGNHGRPHTLLITSSKLTRNVSTPQRKSRPSSPSRGRVLTSTERSFNPSKEITAVFTDLTGGGALRQVSVSTPQRKSRPSSLSASVLVRRLGKLVSTPQRKSRPSSRAQ